MRTPLAKAKSLQRLQNVINATKKTVASISSHLGPDTLCGQGGAAHVDGRTAEDAQAHSSPTLTQRETRLITHAYDMKGTWGLLIKTLFQTGEDACEEQAKFCRKVRVWGQIQKLVVRNAMTYRLPNSRKSNFATEPSPLAREGVHDRTDDAIRPPYGG